MKMFKRYLIISLLVLPTVMAYAESASHTLAPQWYINNAQECVVEQLDQHCRPGVQDCSAITTEGPKLLFRDGVEIAEGIYECEVPLHAN